MCWRWETPHCRSTASSPRSPPLGSRAASGHSAVRGVRQAHGRAMLPPRRRVRADVAERQDSPPPLQAGRLLTPVFALQLEPGLATGDRTRRGWKQGASCRPIGRLETERLLMMQLGARVPGQGARLLCWPECVVAWAMARCCGSRARGTCIARKGVSARGAYGVPRDGGRRASLARGSTYGGRGGCLLGRRS